MPDVESLSNTHGPVEQHEGEEHHLLVEGQQGQQRKREQDWLLTLGRIVNAIAALSALAALAAHAMSLCSSEGKEWWRLDSIRTGLLRFYCIAIAVLIIIVETEWETLLSQMKLLESWVGRGLLQVFLGLMTLELEVRGESDWDKSLRLYKEAAGLSMTGCGLFYILGGVTCIGCLKRSRQRRHLDRMKAERDLAALLKQEEDIKARLASYSKS